VASIYPRLSAALNAYGYVRIKDSVHAIRVSFALVEPYLFSFEQLVGFFALKKDFYGEIAIMMRFYMLKKLLVVLIPASLSQKEVQ
jgi:hypothetical protein